MNFLSDLSKRDLTDPPYLFHPLEPNNPMNQDFTVPKFLQEDIFSLLPENKRPEYRWILLGNDHQ